MGSVPSPRLGPDSTAIAAARPACEETRSLSLPCGTIANFRRSERASGVECVPQAVPEQVEGEGREEHGETREDHQPRLRRVEVRRRREQVAPARGGQLDAEAEERESRLGEDER